MVTPAALAPTPTAGPLLSVPAAPPVDVHGDDAHGDRRATVTTVVTSVGSGLLLEHHRLLVDDRLRKESRVFVEERIFVEERVLEEGRIIVEERVLEEGRVFVEERLRHENRLLGDYRRERLDGD